MTKDIDNRLFGYCRYLKISILKMPKEIFLDSSNIKEYSKIFLVENLYINRYSNVYCDKYDNIIEFTEHKI